MWLGQFPSRLSGVTLSESDVRYYTTNSAGQIDRVILDDVTGDLWEYAALDSVRRLTDEERVEEIAHMLSGATLTEAALNNAKALLGIV